MSRANEAAVRTEGEAELGEAGDGERVENAEEQRHHTEQDGGGLELFHFYTMCSQRRTRSKNLMPTKGSRSPPTP